MGPTTRVSLFIVSVIVTIILCPKTPVAADRTVGLLSRDVRASEGYTLSRPFGTAAKNPPMNIFLLNNAGNPVYKWTTLRPVRDGDLTYLRENGQLIVSSDAGFWALNPDGTLAWEINDLPWERHHEALELSNNHFIGPGWTWKTKEEVDAAGRENTCTPGQVKCLQVDGVYEIWIKNPGCGDDHVCQRDVDWEVVWEWHLWDHTTLDPVNHPELVDINYKDPVTGYKLTGNPFPRINRVDYNPERDEILVSDTQLNEIWIIDHSTTTAEAASHSGGKSGKGGDILYRWGNPYAYGAGAPWVSPTDHGDQILSFQHFPTWITKGLPGAGNILIFNNGQDWGASSVVEITPPIDINGNYIPPSGPGQPYGPKTPTWRYDLPLSYYSPIVSSAQRLPNGNTLINSGTAGGIPAKKAYFFEVTPAGETVWEYLYPRVGYPAASNTVAQGATGPTASLNAYRAWRYPPDYPGLAFLDLVPGDPLETYPTIYEVDIVPDSCANEVSRGGTGLLTAVILGSRDLDVADIDPSSIFLEGFQASWWEIEDASAQGRCKGRDKYPDLVLKFNGDLKSVALRNASEGTTYQLRLTGYSSDGWFLGRDNVTIKK